MPNKPSLGIIAFIITVIFAVITIVLVIALSGDENAREANKNTEIDSNSISETINTSGENTEHQASESESEGITTKTESEPVTTSEQTKKVTESATQLPTAETAGEILSAKLNSTVLQLKVGASAKLVVTLTYTGKVDQKLIWTSSNTSVAKIANDGTVTASGTGTAVISAITSNGKTVSCNVTVSEIAVTEVILNTKAVTISAGGSYTLTASVLPSGATNTTLIWTTSDASIAGCKNGVVTGKAPGKASVTVRSANGKTAVCTVTVTEKSIPAVSVTLSSGSLELKTGEKHTLSATISPSNSTDTSLIWASSNSSVVSCMNGVLTAKSAGSATITVKTANGKAAVCKVTVQNAYPQSITLSESQIELKVGETHTLTAEILPGNAHDKTITWISTNSDIATCENGRITAVSPGVVGIKAKSVNGIESACTVIVKEKENAPTAIELDNTSLTLDIGDQFTLNVKIFPENTASDAALSFSCSDPSVIALDDKGSIIALKEGSASVTVTTFNNLTASCMITVKNPANPPANSLKDFTFHVYENSVAIVSYIGQSSSVIIPSEINTLPVTAVAARAFSASPITSVQIPDSVQQIGEYAFADCANLQTVKLGNGLTEIREYAFSGSAIREITLPKNVSVIGQGAFGRCTALNAITVNAENPYYTSVAGVLFDRTISKLICFPAGNPEISYTIPQSVTEIGSAAFYGCDHLASIILPNALKTIGPSAFMYCLYLTEIILPDSVSSIGASAFAHCRNLYSIVIPPSVSKIEEKTFFNCLALQMIILDSSIETIAEDAFTECSLLTIYCPKDSVAQAFAEENSIHFVNP